MGLVAAGCGVIVFLLRKRFTKAYVYDHSIFDHGPNKDMSTGSPTSQDDLLREESKDSNAVVKGYGATTTGDEYVQQMDSDSDFAESDTVPLAPAHHEKQHPVCEVEMC